ncbi:MAG: acyl-CoA thioesterase II [Myxococcota bacterium]|nr:acyl-CoA thioesterase II [Myxococcales bacterium]
MATLATVLELLDLEPLEENLFRGESPQEEQQRVFGGQVAGQALVAAGRTVDPHERTTHSLHAYFLRTGDPRVPILFQVDRTRDGRSFSTRRVTAIQHGKPIFALSASFMRPEKGIERSHPMPDVPGPDALPSLAERIERFGSSLPDEEIAWMRRERAIEMRHVDLREYLDYEDKSPRNPIWIRTSGPIGSDDPLLHQCLVAYASDMTLIDTAMRPHLRALAASKHTQVASLDHAMWFHRPFRADEWLLYDQESPAFGGARGFTTARLYRQTGELVVSVAQEGLMRLDPGDAAPAS